MCGDFEIVPDCLSSLSCPVCSECVASVCEFENATLSGIGITFDQRYPVQLRYGGKPATLPGIHALTLSTHVLLAAEALNDGDIMEDRN